MDSFFILFQRLVPQHLLSRFTGWLAELESPVGLKNWAIRTFADHFDVDMSEAAEPKLSAYPNFNAFFTRALKDGIRPIDSRSDSLVSPVDGVVSQMGKIEGDQIFQAKGHHYTIKDLLAANIDSDFQDGDFITIYLSPRDYHRMHAPLDCEIKSMLDEALRQAREKQPHLSANVDDYALYNFSIGFEGMGHWESEATLSGLSLTGMKK